MNIRSPRPFDSQTWPGDVLLHPPIDWTDRSPDEPRSRGRQWANPQVDRPWFDHEGALNRVDGLLHAQEITKDEASLLRQWVNDGYFVLRGAFSGDEVNTLDRFRQDLTNVWEAEQPLDGLQVSGVRLDGKRMPPMSHKDLLALPPEVRRTCRDDNSWRIHYFHPHSEAAACIARQQHIIRLGQLILAGDLELMNLSAYRYSSGVGPHQDLMFYHVHPYNAMMGIWVACEDVYPERGPLGVYPKSHLIPHWQGFENYPQTNYRTCHRKTHEAFEQHLVDSCAASGIKRIPMVIKKGDVVFLSGTMVHDASGVDTYQDNSRVAIVLHYAAKGANVIDQVEGPFNY